MWDTGVTPVHLSYTLFMFALWQQYLVSIWLLGIVQFAANHWRLDDILQIEVEH